MAPQSRVTGDVNPPDIIPVTGVVPSPSPTPSSKPSPAPSPNDGNTNNDNNSNNLNKNEGFEASGTYIYMIMGVSILVTVVFFARVCLAKRREKERRHKDFDCEVPPGYEFHLTDIALYNARALGASQSTSNSNPPTTYNPVALSTTSASTAGTLPPPPAAWAGSVRHSTVPADPPTYESLLADYAFVASSASASSNPLPSSPPPRRPST
ncbi:MAG: hypothetical protein JOS17DRAFT_818946 [Linnemannia elongata]|nr:MAG: hypothetical protein JOS17DRAFT_818946 [Linnemannia elongata]